ncbi:MAG: DPP IV N-terminal domain-containing protein, partial [candidate division Zixibacteria bacterium]|nr:DPP IV N-terminal domain-containing protein [candidate division Zixibacteria bacterium]
MKKSRAKAPRRKPITAEDLFRLRIPTSVSLSPDETKITYTVERMDKKENKYFTNLFVYDTESKQEKQFTHGNNNDGAAVWSPDGQQIAFVSTRDKKTGIYLMPSAGGAERQIIQLEGSIGNLQWTPDGKSLVFCLRYSDSHFIKDEKKKKEPPVYRHITRLYYRLDGAGFLPRDTFQVYALDIATTKLRRITSGKRNNVDPCLSPDGRWVAYISNRQPDPDMEMLRDDLFVIPFKGGREKKIPTPPGPKNGPKFSPNGKFLAYMGHDNPKDAWGVTNIHVWKAGVSGKPKARDLMPAFDRMVVDLSITDTSDAHFTTPVAWSADGKRIFFVASDTGATNLYYVPASGGKPTRIFQGKCHIKGYAVNGKSRRAAIIYADINNPGDI